MKVKQVLTPLAILALLALSAGQASAQWIVHDPTSYANHVLRYEQLIREYQMFWYEFKGILNLNNYKSPRTILRILQAAQLSANASELHEVLNRESTPKQIDLAFDSAITRIRTLRQILQTARWDPVQAARDMLELLDASSKSAIGTIGQIREAEDDYQLALKNLDGDTGAAFGIKSSNKSVLQKINSASMMQVKEQHKTNELLLHLLEQQMLMNQQYREAFAAAVNDEAHRRERFDDIMSFAQTAEVPPLTR